MTTAAALQVQNEASDNRTISLLGATGSVGQSTLDVIAADRNRFQVNAVTAWRDVDGLAAAARRVEAKVAVIGNPDLYSDLRTALEGTGIEAAGGEEALVEAAARPADMVVGGIVGAAGIRPSYAALEAGATLALANKECLVSAGNLFMDKARARNTTILPVDSEHNAIFQILETETPESVRSITLTASGGPFRGRSLDDLKSVTLSDALAHPTWTMGAKITIDSATLMNKGLEVIEATHLFRDYAGRIDVLIHPQSIVHGLVSYSDGSVLAQMGAPDMRVPIAVCLNWPARLDGPGQHLDLTTVAPLTFEKPNLSELPCLALALDALERGPAATNALNAANEVAVAAFLSEKIRFLDIARIVGGVLNTSERDGILSNPESLEDVFMLDFEARHRAESEIADLAA